MPTHKSKVFAMGYWISQLCDNSLSGMDSSYDSSWGLLKWKQELNGDNFIRVDVLDSSNVALVLDITGESTDSINYKIDISKFEEISSTQDIKIRFRLYRLSDRCRIYDIYLSKKVKGMVTTNLLGQEVRDWLARDRKSVV